MQDAVPTNSSTKIYVTKVSGLHAEIRIDPSRSEVATFRFLGRDTQIPVGEQFTTSDGRGGQIRLTVEFDRSWGLRHEGGRFQPARLQGEDPAWYQPLVNLAGAVLNCFRLLG